MPNGKAQLLISLNDDVLRDYRADGSVLNETSSPAVQGARGRPTMIDTRCQRWLCGVTFRPGGAAALARVPASELTGYLVELNEIWPELGRSLPARLVQLGTPHAQLNLLERLLVDRLHHTPPNHRLSVAADLLQRGRPVAEVAVAVELSSRRLITLFRNQVGLTPKLFARIERVQRILRSGASDWADAAAAAGFSDQAHLVREFKTFTGTTPTRYVSREAGLVNHRIMNTAQFSSIQPASVGGTLAKP